MSITLPPIPLPSIDTWPNTPEKLRARDIEVARVVLEAACSRVSRVNLEEDGADIFDYVRAIRNLEVSHE